MLQLIRGRFIEMKYFISHRVYSNIAKERKLNFIEICEILSFTACHTVTHLIYG